MNLTEILQAERDLLRGQDTKSADDPLLTRLTDQMILSLVRDQVEANQGYHNQELNLFQTDFHETAHHFWDVQLPTWVMRVVDVWRRTAGGSDPAELSPWESDDRDRRNGRMRRSVTKDEAAGWEQIGDLFRIRQRSQAEDLLLRVAKEPSPLLRATLTERQERSESITLPATLDLGTLKHERGAYMGARLTVKSSTTEMLGQPLLVTASKVVNDGQVELTLARASDDDLRSGDVIESLLALDRAHARLVVLRVARAVFQRDGNIRGLRAIGDELAEETVRYKDFITPRQSQEPSIAKTSLDRRFHDPEPDRATWLTGRDW